MDEALYYWEDVNDVLDNLGDEMEFVEPHSMVGVPNADWECRYCEFSNRCENKGKENE